MMQVRWFWKTLQSPEEGFKSARRRLRRPMKCANEKFEIKQAEVARTFWAKVARDNWPMLFYGC